MTGGKMKFLRKILSEDEVFFYVKMSSVELEGQWPMVAGVSGDGAQRHDGQHRGPQAEDRQHLPALLPRGRLGARPPPLSRPRPGNVNEPSGL